MDKIEYIIDNDGTELADGYSGLLKYFRYVAPDEIVEMILEKTADIIDDHYQEVKYEVDAHELDTVDAVFKSTKHFITNSPLNQDQKNELMELLKDETSN